MNNFKYKLTLAVILLFISKISTAQSLLHYWNFNTTSSYSAHITSNTSVISGAALDTLKYGIGTSIIDHLNGTGQGFDANNFNTRNSDVAGNHLRFNNPIYGGLRFSLPTTGYKDIVVKYSSLRSGSGAYLQFIHYTTDGTNYILFDTIRPTTTATLYTLDFTNKTNVKDNSNFKVRITFGQGGGGVAGNNRIDNFTMEGVSNTGSDLIAPTVVFNPTKNSDFVAVNLKPTFTFSEDIRLINNTSITNPDSLIILKLNDSLGSNVAFTSSIAGKVITITPSSNLSNKQVYYIALKANRVEDLNNNALVGYQFSNFKTIAAQTPLTAGDIVPVAYRMNATGADDEIAFLSFINISEGTIINLTDAKYTDNTQPQCAGGLSWTAPTGGLAAGSVVSINLATLVATKGTVTGSGFGLSSGGDQVIFYTGTPVAPSFVTALSSNAWIGSNIVCSGSVSKIPATLADGISSINLSTANGNVSGNSVNGFYKGIQNLSKTTLKDSILNPLNWQIANAGTNPQTWPTWAFPGPPSVISTKVINNITLQVVFNKDLDNASAININNYTGIAGLASVTRTNNGQKADTLTLNYTNAFTNATNYSLIINNVKDVDNLALFAPYTYTFTYNTNIAWEKNFVVINEATSTLTLNLNLTNPSVSSVFAEVQGTGFSTASSEDYTFTSKTLNFTGTSNSFQSITIPINNDNISEQDEYFVITLKNALGASIIGDPSISIYIRDNDRMAPVQSKSVELKYVSSFDPSPLTGSTTEIVVHDSATNRLFITNAIQDRLDIADFSNPSNITLIKSIDMNSYGGITSVAVKNGIVAVASPNANEQLDGQVVFFNTNGDYLKKVTVGALPDNISFSPDGTKILTANEGQPSIDYLTDPEGSVSIIDVSTGIANVSQASVSTLNFTSFNTQENTLKANGVRKTKASSTLSQDFEPEYITTSADSKKAWVVLQENNAIAEIDLASKTITSIWALGTKNWNTGANAFDASDNNKEILLSNWPIKSFFMPDGIANYSIGGTTYIVTANEGDEKEYATLNERVTVNSPLYKLDSAKFPNAAFLKKDYNLGRLRVSNLNGDTDNDGDFDEIYMVGARSFSIFNTNTKSLTYDNASDFELITSQDTSINKLFNADNGNNTLKNRSRAKGPEPEGVALANIQGKYFAFISLERVGGVMVYDITNSNAPIFVNYANSRNKNTFAGDNGPEGIIYIAKNHTANGKSYVLIANEVSGTISSYEVISNMPNVGILDVANPDNLIVFPNPVNSKKVYFSQTINLQLLDIQGKIVAQLQQADQMNVENLTKGIYILKTDTGITRKIIIE